MKTQAWGWLAAAVLAAGLNASYHDGGLEWAHRVAEQVGHNTNAVLALATGRADQFLAEARFLTHHDEAASCPWSTPRSQVQSMMADSDAEYDRFEVLSDRQQAQLARFEANRARIEARVQAQVARIRIPAMAFNPVVTAPRISVCPRVRVNISHLPVIKVPATPVIHIETSGMGPV